MLKGESMEEEEPSTKHSGEGARAAMRSMLDDDPDADMLIYGRRSSPARSLMMLGEHQDEPNHHGKDEEADEQGSSKRSLGILAMNPAHTALCGTEYSIIWIIFSCPSCLFLRLVELLVKRPSLLHIWKRWYIYSCP